MLILFPKDKSDGKFADESRPKVSSTTISAER